MESRAGRLSGYLFWLTQRGKPSARRPHRSSDLQDTVVARLALPGMVSSP